MVSQGIIGRRNSILRLKGSIEIERQFIANVAYGLKTPLVILESSIEIALLKKRSNKEYKKIFSELLVDIKRASTTFNRIMELAWIKVENIKVQGKLFDFSEFVRELQEITEKMSFSKGITVSGKITSGIKLFGEKGKLARAILNIIDNAIKFTPKHGRINITLVPKENIILKIQDNGVGIDQKDLPYIFEPFYRGLMSDENKGLGLGLAITQEVIRTHHGVIDVDSAVGVGTKVTITLPPV